MPENNKENKYPRSAFLTKLQKVCSDLTSPWYNFNLLLKNASLYHSIFTFNYSEKKLLIKTCMQPIDFTWKRILGLDICLFTCFSTESTTLPFFPFFCTPNDLRDDGWIRPVVNLVHLPPAFEGGYSSLRLRRYFGMLASFWIQENDVKMLYWH